LRKPFSFRKYSRRSVLKTASAGSFAAAFLAACGGGSSKSSSSGTSGGSAASSASSGASSGAAQANLAKDQKLVVRQNGEPVGFDPATLFRIDTESIAMNFYAALTSYDPLTAQPQPDLAKSWEVSPEGTQYTFKLIDNGTWHQNYGAFTSTDVKYTYERVLNPATSSIYAPELNNIDSVEVPDKSTVVVKLKTPDANFLYQVGNYHQGQILNQAAVEKFGDQYPRNPVGLGPFEMVEWIPNTRVVLKRFDGYHKGPATLEQVTFNLITDASAGEVALMNGEISVYSPGTDPDRIKRLTDAKFEFNTAKGNSISILMFNPDVTPLNDKRVRQAFAYAMDTKAIIQQLYPGLVEPAYSILPPWMDMYSDSVPKYEHDQAKAKSLMDAAGVKSATLKYLSGGAPSDDLLLRQAQLKEVGINMEFDVVDVPVFNSRRTAGSFEISNRVYPAVNPDTLLFGYLHPDNLPPKGFNSAKYNNPTLTSLLEKARAEQDQAKRKDLYAQVQRIAAEDLPYLPVTAGPTNRAFFPWVKNIQVDRLSDVNFYTVFAEDHG
jgi:peptide/nickel transport system substrate-binding protein